MTIFLILMLMSIPIVLCACFIIPKRPREAKLVQSIDNYNDNVYTVYYRTLIGWQKLNYHYAKSSAENDFTNYILYGMSLKPPKQQPQIIAHLSERDIPRD